MNRCSKTLISAYRASLLDKNIKCSCFSTQRSLNSAKHLLVYLNNNPKSWFSSYKNQQQLLKTYEKIKEK